MAAVAFALIALIVVGAALGLVLKRNPIHGAQIGRASCRERV